MRKWIELDPVSAELEMAEFLHGFVRMLKPEIIVETGTYHGHTANFLGASVQMNGCGHVWTCDIERAIGHLQRLDGLPVTFVKCSSLDLPELREADFVFSDSGQDIRAKEYELVKPGCVFVVHDTAVSYSTNTDQHWLGKWVLANGGLNFNAGRGFGVLIKPTK
jgi:predicted O-methyltransferase YrrM